MIGPVTYRELMDDAAGALTGVHTLSSVGFRDPADAVDTAAAWRRLVATGIRHAVLLAPHDDLVAALPRLRPARRPVRPGGNGPLHPAGQALLRSGELLGLAHDVLASHLGPERQHRTPDAALIESSGPYSPALRALSSMVLTAAVSHQALARRSLELAPAPSRVPAPVTRILREGVAVLGPAARLHDRARAGEQVDDRLGRLAAATALTAPDTRAGPAGQLAGALSRLRVAAHRQGHGELPAGAATMRALTAVATTLVRRDLDGARFARLTPGQRSALAVAGRSWSQLHEAWGEVATLDTGSRGVLYDAVTATRLLHDDDPCAAGWGTAAPMSGTADWVSSVAESLAAATTRLTHGGPILVPTRWCEGADIPRPWASAWPEHVERLTDLHQATVRDSVRLPPRQSWSPTRGSITAVPSLGPELARTS